MPKFSILLPAYKTAFLREAIASILAQTYEDFELIISDDCSPEPVKAIYDEFSSDPRIRYRRNESNIGAKRLVDHWNILLYEAKGEYVIFPGDDDLLLPNYLEEANHIFSSPLYNVARVRCRRIDENGIMIEDDPAVTTLQTREEFIKSFYSDVLISCLGCFIFKRYELIENGGFVYFDYGWGSDEATAFKMADRGIVQSSSIQYYFRKSELSISGNQSRALVRKKLLAYLDYYTWLMKFNPDPFVDKAFQTRFFWNKIEALSLSEIVRATITLLNFRILLSWIKRRLVYQTQR